MKRLTAKQQYVFRNLERVTPRRYQLNVSSPILRYNLDGWECSAQITGLAVRGAIKRLSCGTLERRAVPSYAWGNIVKA